MPHTTTTNERTKTMPKKLTVAEDLVRTSNQCHAPLIPVLTNQDKKNDAAKRITDTLGRVYLPESKLAGELREALAKKLTLIELGQLLTMAMTSGASRDYR